jgi:type II restriction enzyme
LNAIPDTDGEQLLALLTEPREAIPIDLPKHAPRQRQRHEAPEPGLLEAQAVTLELPVEEQLEETSSTEPRTHTEIQAKLRDIGLFEGFDVWVADRGISWNGRLLGEGCLTDLPVVASERTRRVMRMIDVIWFRKGAGHPVRFFEIEHTTSVYSGLLRFNDVIIDFPIPEAFVVGDGEKTSAKFEREIARRTFDHSGLRHVTKFLLYDQVRQTWKKYREVGTGSKEWGEHPGAARSAETA